jgi:hypothetical protein
MEKILVLEQGEARMEFLLKEVGDIKSRTKALEESVAQYEKARKDLSKRIDEILSE